MSKNSKIFIILGPTSSGKTSIALDLCKIFDGEIISADSRQVCKFMDIGTGKVPVKSDINLKKYTDHWELNDVKVWGYDLVSPDDFFSGYDFADYSLKKAKEILEKGKTVFLVGGTGFYVDLFTGKMKPSKVLPDLNLRDSLEKLSLSDLQNKLKALNEKAFQNIDQKNKVRLIRAIEKELSIDVRNEQLPYLDDAKFTYIGLTGDRDYLYKRVDNWVDEIWDGGLIDEVKSLVEMGYGDSSKIKGIVYKEVFDYIEGNLKKSEAMQKTKFNLHSYIRRQQTWFKKNNLIEWFDITKDDFKEIIYNRIKENL